MGTKKKLLTFAFCSPMVLPGRGNGNGWLRLHRLRALPGRRPPVNDRAASELRERSKEGSLDSEPKSIGSPFGTTV